MIPEVAGSSMFGFSPLRNSNSIRSSRFYHNHYSLPSFMQSLLTPSTYYFISTIVFHLYITSNKSIVTSAFSATRFRHFHHTTFLSSSTFSNNNKSSSSLPMTSTTTPPSSSSPTSTPEDDPYTYLEDVESDTSLQFARDANDKCLSTLGNPETSSTGTYDKVLKVLESNERIPHVTKYGVNEEGEMVLFNFWKDGTNPKGIWRSTTLSSYRTPTPTWSTILDIDALGKNENISWVFKGSTPLPRSRDPLHSSRHVTRALMKLSNGGADAITLREFDLPTGRFVEEEEGGFHLAKEAKTRASYRSRDVLSIGSDFGGDSLTDSGYPRTVREWIRGTRLDEAPVVFEGEKSDVSVGAYVDDQRHRGGWIYDVRYRHLDFYRSLTWVRRVEFEMLLARDDPKRMALECEEEEWVKLDVPEDASVDFFGKLMFIKIKSDWDVGGMTYKIGSLLIVDYDDFTTKGKDACQIRVLFSPTATTALESYAETKNYLVLEIMDNVKSRLVFYKHDAATGDLSPVYGLNEEAQIRSSYIGALDPRDNDLFWFTTSDYTMPSTLYLADAAVFDNDGTATNGATDNPDPFILEKLKSLPPQYDSSSLATVQRFATSADGTKVPYFLIYNKDGGFEKGCTPTMLYGYGGFEISLTAHYTGTSGVAWLERGGAYVEANIRGGGEFGPGWHQAALKEKRNKSYEDFIAVAEDLISSGLCTPQTLATRGGSNGGLLMGNMLTMRPDVFGAIHCAVPLLDMKKYHKLLAGASWMAEYGDPDTDDWESFLKKYSPYHNLKSDVEYPPILFTTSTRDDRVHPAHARKMVKKMWDMDDGRGRWNVHYYENIEGGHGGAADSKQSAFMTALAFDFCWNTLTKSNEK